MTADCVSCWSSFCLIDQKFFYYHWMRSVVTEVDVANDLPDSLIPMYLFFGPKLIMLGADQQFTVLSLWRAAKTFRSVVPMLSETFACDLVQTSFHDYDDEIWWEWKGFAHIHLLSYLFGIHFQSYLSAAKKKKMRKVDVVVESNLSNMSMLNRSLTWKCQQILMKTTTWFVVVTDTGIERLWDNIVVV